MFLWSHEKQFRQPFRKLFAQKNTTIQKLFQFVPKQFLKLYLWTRRTKFLKQCCKIFAGINRVSAQSPKKWTEKKLNLLYFTSKRWSGHAESCLGKPATFFRKNSINFRSPSEEVGKVYNGFERTIFLQSAAFDTCNSLQITLPKFFLPKVWEVFAYCPKNPEKMNISLKNLFFLKILLWLSLMLFCKSGQNFSEKGLKIYYLKFGIDKLFLVFSEIQNPSNCFSGHLECSLHNAEGKRSSKLWEKFRSESEILETCLTFSKLIASKSFSELKTCSFNKPAVIFPPQVKRNISQKQKMLKNFQAKSENVPVGTPIAV